DGKEDRGENRDNGDHDEELDQGEAAARGPAERRLSENDHGRHLPGGRAYVSPLPVEGKNRTGNSWTARGRAPPRRANKRFASTGSSRARPPGPVRAPWYY